MSTIGSGTAAWASANAAASRSPGPPPRWPITSNPAGSQPPTAPSSAITRRAADVAATTSSVSASAAWATSAASSGRSGGVSPVLTRPGAGASAMTMTWVSLPVSMAPTLAARGRIDLVSGLTEV